MRCASEKLFSRAFYQFDELTNMDTHNIHESNACEHHCEFRFLQKQYFDYRINNYKFIEIKHKKRALCISVMHVWRGLGCCAAKRAIVCTFLSGPTLSGIKLNNIQFSRTMPDEHIHLIHLHYFYTANRHIRARMANWGWQIQTVYWIFRCFELSIDMFYVVRR